MSGRWLPLCIALALAACSGDDGPSGDDSSEERDAGSRPDGRADSGGGGNARLDALAGRYLMRWDVLGTASSPSPIGGQIQIRSRVSTLVVAELAVDGGALTAKERVCTQVIKQKCSMGCDSATTTVDARVIDDFLPERQQQRLYTLSDDGTFRGERSVAQLGYDDPNLDAPLPTTTSDPRVWDVVAGNSVREGFLSQIKVSLLLSVTCNAYGAQKFVTAFSGKLGGSESAPEIPQMELDLEGADVANLGSDNPTCAAQEVDDAPIELANARMVRYGDGLSEDAFWACPGTGVFDQQLPPTEPNL